MYSKYLDYTDTAIRAHQVAQVENDQKDILINQLKNQLYELRQLEEDYLRLNDLISSLEDKYSLLLDEKDRSEKQQRVKNDIDKNTLIQLNDDINNLQVQLQKLNIKIEDLLRQNTGMKRMSDARAGEIHNLRNQIKSAEGRNQRAYQENKGLSLTIKGLKQQRKRLEDECDKLSGLLDAQIAKLKNIQKNARNSESTNARLDKTLHQAQNDNAKLVSELKEKHQEAKKAEIRLKTLRNNAQQLKLTYRNIIQQVQKNKADNGTNVANLQNQIAKGKQIANRLQGVEAAIRAQQNELDLIIAEQEKLRKEHYAGIQKNKALNSEIDRLLALISEYQAVNKELLDEIAIYIDEDQEARNILNRRQCMKSIIDSTLRKIALTGEPIKHLKY